MKELQILDGKKIGYTLPKGISDILEISNHIITVDQYINVALLNNPIIKEISKISLNITPIIKIVQNNPKVINFITSDLVKLLKFIESNPLDDRLKINTPNSIKEIKQKLLTENNITSDKNTKKSKLEFSDILSLIGLLISLITVYPAIKDIYKDLTYDPIAEICGVITELEKEAVKFAEVNNRGGTQLYKYPKGKKSEYYLPESTQICMLNQPKGNKKRVKVIFKAENNKQIIGYVDRNKIKRIYNIN